MWLLFVCFFERLGDEYFSWWYVQHMLPYGTDTVIVILVLLLLQVLVLLVLVVVVVTSISLYALIWYF